MKKTLTTLFLVAILILSGCANQEEKAYDQAMKKGQAALVSKNYDAAAKYFKEALSHKKNDKKATILSAQTYNFNVARRLMDDPDQAIKALNGVILQKSGSGILRKDARELRDQAMTLKQKKTEGASTGTSVSNSEAASSSSSSASSSGSSDGSSAASSSSSQSSSTASSSATVTQQQAEEAVIKAAGYTPDEVYIDTTDDGAYYSMELRENHQNDSAADPDTAPSAGFFRYYKDTGKITQLDLISNTYKEVKN